MSTSLRRTVSTVARLSTIAFVASSLGACAVGSMGAMMSDGPNAVAALGGGSDVQFAQSEERTEFVALAQEVETPVWAAVEATDAPRGGRMNFGSVMGVLLAGAEPAAAAPQEESSTAERYLASMAAIFDQPSDIPVAVAVDIFSKNAEARRFVSSARGIVASHDRPVTAVNAAYQAGEMDAGAYRTELARLDADRRVLSGVVTAMREQRRTFVQVRSLIAADQPGVDLSRMDEELTALAQYEDMVTRLSAELAGELEAGS